MTFSITTLITTAFSIAIITRDIQQDDRVLFMLSVTNKSFMLSVVILNVIMPSVVAPLERIVSIVFLKNRIQKKAISSDLWPVL
jgi:hypothetical protein